MVKPSLRVKGEAKIFFLAEHKVKQKEKPNEETTKKTMLETQKGDAALEGYTLAFDASSSKLSFCLWCGEQICLRWVFQENELENEHKSEQKNKIWAEDLPSFLEREIVKENQRLEGEGGEGFSYPMLRRVCFVRGPGSYTGLRACLSVARGFRLACDGLNLYSVTSFEAGLLSFGKHERRGRVLSLVESFRDVCYGQLFEGGRALGGARVLDDDALRLWVFHLLEENEKDEGGGGGSFAGGGLRVVGSAAERVCAEVLERFPKERLVLGSLGDACDFSRDLVGGDLRIYARGEEALQPIYMGSPV